MNVVVRLVGIAVRQKNVVVRHGSVVGNTKGIDGKAILYCM